MINHIKKISQKLNSKFYYNYDMSKHVWFRSGGKTAIFCLVYDINELQIILNEIGNYPFEVIGSGSNLLIRDSGFSGMILKLGKKFNKIEICDTSINVGASILDVNLAKFAEINNIKNFEFYSGIPGSIGGAVKMNAGCFGYETKDIIKEVTIINKNGSIKKYLKDQLDFKYRFSNLPMNSIVISANYNFLYGKKEEIFSKMNVIKEKRNKTQPIKAKTSGSTFKNPNNHYAAKLIDQCGCKGMSFGGAYVSEMHANFLINKNNATASEIEHLGLMIIDKVYSKFNIKLEWEIKIIG